MLHLAVPPSDSPLSVAFYNPTSSTYLPTALSVTDKFVRILSFTDILALQCFGGSKELLTICLLKGMTQSRVLPPDDLVQFFGSKPGVPVTALEVSHLDSRNVEAVTLRAFPHLRRIYGNGLETGLRILEQLGTAVVSNDESAICPGLASLTLEIEFDLDSDWPPGGRGEDSGSDADGADSDSDSDSEPPWMESRMADVEDYFRELCAHAEHFLSWRAGMGEKLPEVKLEPECRKTRRLGSSDEPLWTASWEA
ncbi:hypothetical protein GSI_04664 [Ganoderma sinense ZZ0214-1]|uniref:Uncharacterized protein n=1 Tax=Ganoderma sinense ZZ0214-1 TaxID=1077348 RepID=A0A2G8SHG2_9APHY|nr:hypothetical protein GSI_04664 [Ganoderma sinense ZZ0214-1]